MKKAIILLLCVSVFLSCKKDAKSEATDEQAAEVKDGRTTKQSDGLTLLKGEFIYYGDAAVLQTHKEMYAVIIDEKMHELEKKAKPFKTENTDFVNVEIRGKITPKPEGEEGWNYRVKIKEILNVSKIESNNNTVIKLEQ